MFSRNAGAGNVEYAAFGTRNTLDSAHGWSSHGVCITSRCQAGVAWSVSVATPRAALLCNAHTSCQVNFESGGGNDCIEETTWRYGKFTCFLASDS